MLDAAIAFDAALHQCQPPPYLNDSEALIVHVSVFRESERPEKYYGEPLPPTPPGEIKAVGQPMVRRMRSVPCLHTRFGALLEEHNMITKLLGTCAVFLVAAVVIDPGAVHTKFKDPGTESMVDVIKSHPAVVLVRSCLFAAGLFLVFHRISWDLLKLCAFSFDSVMIVVSSAFCEFALHSEQMRLRAMMGDLNHLDVALVVVFSLLRIAGHGVVSVMDAWTISVRAKIAVLAPFTISLSFSYVKQRFLRQWSHKQYCYSPVASCTTWQNIYLSFLANEIVFSLKLLVPYVRQRTYGILKIGVIDPNTECYHNGRVSRRDASNVFQVENAESLAHTDARKIHQFDTDTFSSSSCSSISVARELHQLNTLSGFVGCSDATTHIAGTARNGGKMREECDGSCANTGEELHHRITLSSGRQFVSLPDATLATIVGHHSNTMQQLIAKP